MNAPNPFKRTARSCAATTATALSSSAVEMLAASKDPGGDAESLRHRAAGLQAEALRCLLAAMAARAVAERLSVISQLQVEGGKWK